MKNGRKAAALLASVALAGTGGGAGASGFALIEQNASGIGNAYAGAAAVADDASTIFFNPAGMTRLPGMQFVAAAHAIRPSAKFTNAGSTLAPLQTSLGGNGGDAGDWAFVPNAYFSWQISPRWFVGVGLNAPFGLKTEYDPAWVGRFHAIESELKTININPSVAFKVNDALSVGAGVNYQRAEATLSNAVNYSAAAFAVGGAGLLALVGGAGVEGVGRMEGDDHGWGYNLGALFNVGEHTRLGLAYRSPVNYKVEGSVAFGNRPAALAAGLSNGPVSADLKVPGSASWSIFHRLNPRWDVMADVSWTGWSTITSLTIVRSGGALLSSVPLEWRDTWRVSAGGNYRHSNAWTLRFGLAYDQSPVPDAHRTPRIPDQDRTWLALGLQYRPSKQVAIDVGYAYLFVRNATSRLCDAAGAAANALACAGRNALMGSYDNDVNILSAQFRYAF
jgi:long-chain fatty acid transport protein